MRGHRCRWRVRRRVWGTAVDPTVTPACHLTLLQEAQATIAGLFGRRLSRVVRDADAVLAGLARWITGHLAGLAH